MKAHIPSSLVSWLEKSSSIYNSCSYDSCYRLVWGFDAFTWLVEPSRWPSSLWIIHVRISARLRRYITGQTNEMMVETEQWFNEAHLNVVSTPLCLVQASWTDRIWKWELSDRLTGCITSRTTLIRWEEFFLLLFRFDASVQLFGYQRPYLLVPALNKECFLSLTGHTQISPHYSPPEYPH